MTDAEKPSKPRTLAEATDEYDRQKAAQDAARREQRALKDARSKSGRLARATAQLEGQTAAPKGCESCGGQLYSNGEIEAGICAHCYSQHSPTIDD